jgi:hypothetical protein
MIILWVSASQIWHTTTLSKKLGIICKRLENIRLSQRKLHFLVLIIKVHHKVLDLAHMSTLSKYRNQHLPCHTSSPHSRALRSLPFVLRQIAKSCCNRCQTLATSSASPSRVYLNAPFANMAGLLFGFGPVKRRSNSSAAVPSMPCSHSSQRFARNCRIRRTANP